jgi:toxin-antitoxin system PIN domain toxin
MIALDTNLLIYAHRAGAREHRAARTIIENARGTSGGAAITLPSIAEFFSIVTHPASSGRPSTPAEAHDFLAALQEGGVALLGPGQSFATRLVRLAGDLEVTGARIFDLQIGLCALDGGATEMWTRDRGFVKVPGLAVKHPL